MTRAIENENAHLYDGTDNQESCHASYSIFNEIEFVEDNMGHNVESKNSDAASEGSGIENLIAASQTINDSDQYCKFIEEKESDISSPVFFNIKRKFHYSDCDSQTHKRINTDDEVKIRNPPSGLKGVDLLPYQTDGASWMYHQEYHVQDIHGGILADEMGMGKTLQTIVVMLDNRPLLQHSIPGSKHLQSLSDVGDRLHEESLWDKSLTDWKVEMDVVAPENAQAPATPVPRGGTLIVCPMVAISQWKAEIEKFTEDNTFSICMYYGPQRESMHTIDALAKFDIVITTYALLENDFRRMVAPNKVKCPNCNKKFIAHKLSVHLQHYCKERQNPEFISLEQINMDELHKEAVVGSKQSVLHSISWWRIVLDEAHNIKTRSSGTAAGAFALTSIHRWCLTGTPLQNRVDELYSLTRFLRIDPISYYFCDYYGCDCKTLHYCMKNSRCIGCNHAASQHSSYFNKYILNPIQKHGCKDKGKEAYTKLQNEILDKCMLRRTKQTRADDVKLPPRLVAIRYIKLHPIEDDIYQSLYTKSKANFDDYVQAGTVLNNYAHIFVLLLRLRQVVCHPFLVIHAKGKNVQVKESCCICHSPLSYSVQSACCGSVFCASCVDIHESVSADKETLCPHCGDNFTIDPSQVGTNEKHCQDTTTARLLLPNIPNVANSSILTNFNLNQFATSSKIEALTQELIEMRRKRPGSKALVFSQFVPMLDLVRWRLESDPCLASFGLGVQIIRGDMSNEAREKAIKEFREDSSCRILLMSLKAAGVALNLTVASECFLLDVWWNPASEMQAIDRTHRLGQYRPIRVVRFIAEGTIEERVLQLQEKKRLVFDGTIGRDASSLQKLSQAELTRLFTPHQYDDM